MAVGNPSESVLFVGGPLDGQRHDVSDWPVQAQRTVAALLAPGVVFDLADLRDGIQRSQYVRLVVAAPEVDWVESRALYVLAIFAGWPEEGS